MNNLVSQLIIKIGKDNMLSNEEFEKCISEIDFQLPTDYLNFLRQTNGGETFLDNDKYVMFWRAENLSEYNKMYAVAEFAPNLFLIGSNGGNDAYGISRTEGSFLEVPFVGMSNEAITILGKDFDTFISSLNG